MPPHKRNPFRIKKFANCCVIFKISITAWRKDTVSLNNFSENDMTILSEDALIVGFILISVIVSKARTSAVQTSF
jgi:hypothetical protein